MKVWRSFREFEHIFLSELRIEEKKQKPLRKLCRKQIQTFFLTFLRLQAKLEVFYGKTEFCCGQEEKFDFFHPKISRWPYPSNKVFPPSEVSLLLLQSTRTSSQTPTDVIVAVGCYQSKWLQVYFILRRNCPTNQLPEAAICPFQNLFNQKFEYGLRNLIFGPSLVSDINAVVFLLR